MSEIIQAGAAPCAALLKQYKNDRESADARLVNLVRDIADTEDDRAGWFCLKLVREYLCTIPVHGVYTEVYGHFLIHYQNLLLCLDGGYYSEACYELSDMIRCGCTVYTNIHTLVVHTLTVHPNLQKYQPTERK